MKHKHLKSDISIPENFPLRSGFFQWLIGAAVLFLVSCGVYQPVYQTSQLRVVDSLRADQDILEIITPYRTKLEDEMNEVIGEFAGDMTRAKPESSLGNFVCDMLLAEGRKLYGDDIDFAVYNYGGIRIDVIGAGPVTRGKIYELLPFENFAVVVRLSGKETLELIQKMIDEKGWPMGGIRFRVVDNKPVDILINELPFDENKSYHVIMNDYMAQGGDDLSFLKEVELEMLNVTVRDLAIQYLQNEYKNGRKINSTVDGRIQYE